MADSPVLRSNSLRKGVQFFSPAKVQRRQVIITVASSIFIRLWRTRPISCVSTNYVISSLPAYIIGKRPLLFLLFWAQVNTDFFSSEKRNMAGHL